MQSFNADASANELGVFRFETGWIQAFPSADAPWPSGLIRQAMEVDPGFRLLWVVNVWRSPNEGIRKTGQYMIARHRLNPAVDAGFVRNPMLPTGPVAGVYQHPPFLAVDILDGRTETDYSKGKLPKFAPFTGRHVESLRKALWKRRNKSVEEQISAEVAEHEAAGEPERKRADKRRQRQEDAQPKRPDRVFVSSTLSRLRESAGYSVGAA